MFFNLKKELSFGWRIKESKQFYFNRIGSAAEEWWGGGTVWYLREDSNTSNQEISECILEETKLPKIHKVSKNLLDTEEKKHRQKNGLFRNEDTAFRAWEAFLCDWNEWGGREVGEDPAWTL